MRIIGIVFYIISGLAVWCQYAGVGKFGDSEYIGIPCFIWILACFAYIFAVHSRDKNCYMAAFVLSVSQCFYFLTFELEFHIICFRVLLSSLTSSLSSFLLYILKMPKALLEVVVIDM